VRNYDRQGRDDRLAYQIIDAMESIRLRSQGAHDELSTLLGTARYPVSAQKIMKLSWPQLQGMWTLVSGFSMQTAVTLQPVLDSSIRPVLSIANVHQPFTIKRPDGTIQHCFLAAAAVSAYTFLPSNKTGAPSSNVAMGIFAHNLAAGELPMISKRNDYEIFVRNHDLVTTALGADAKIRRVYLNAAGAIQTAYLKDDAGVDITLTAGAATFVDRPHIEDFCDGVNLWAFEYDDTNNALRIHKVNLSTGEETIAVVSNIKLGVTGGAYFEGAFFAVGDHAVLMAQQLTGNKSQVMFFELPDGNATTTLDFNVGAPPQVANSVGGDVIPYYTRALVDTTELRGFHLSAMTPDRKVRAFLTPNLAGTSVNPINVVTIDPVVVRSATPAAGDTAGNVVVEKILGQTDGTAIWPLPRTSLAVSNANMQRAAVAADGERLIAVNGAATPWDVLMFGVGAKRQISSMVPVSSRVTTLDRLSRINASGANMLAVVTTLSDIALLELSI